MTVHLPLMDYAPWSPSKANLASQCGKAFEHRYIKKTKGLQKGSAARVGNTVHKAQELILGGEKTAEAITQAIEGEADLTHTEKETVQTFADALNIFVGKLNEFGHKHPIKETLVESQWAIDSEFNACDYWSDTAMIRGIVDVALLLESGYLIVIDHKSGKKKPISKFAQQLDIYTVMGFSHYPDVKGVQTAINFMAFDADVKWGPSRNPKYINDVLKPWLLTYLGNKVTNLKTFDANITPLCGWCDYRLICEDWLSHGERK